MIFFILKSFYEYIYQKYCIFLVIEYNKFLFFYDLFLDFVGGILTEVFFWFQRFMWFLVCICFQVFLYWVLLFKIIGEKKKIVEYL